MAKCKECKKKLSMVEKEIGKCKCNKYYCAKHRGSGKHNCTYDYKKEVKDILKEKMPEVSFQKVSVV
tara:strand:+ start:365 stop:565 length:201 start_codon:yes stop_codon:yes gene_type:complete